MPRSGYTKGEIIRMRDAGMKYHEIAELTGTSKQAAWGRVNRTYSHSGGTVEWGRKVIFPGLAKWMTENKVSRHQLEKMTRKSLSGIVGATDMKKSAIDAVLAITGMTYEECFGSETDERPEPGLCGDGPSSDDDGVHRSGCAGRDGEP